MKNRRIRQFAVLASSALLALGATTGIAGQPASAAVQASAPTHLPATILTPVAGSAKYLAYTKVTRPAPGRTRTGGLFVLTNGKSKPRRLASVTGGEGAYFMAGSMLVYSTSKRISSQTIDYYTHWINVDTGETGRVLDSGSTYAVAAAPDGWITLDTTNGTLVDQATDGTSRSLGQPVPQSTEPLVVGGTNDLVVYSVYSDDSNGNGELRVMSFDHPGVFRTLIPSLKDATEEDYYCPSVASHLVACETEGARVRLIPLDGSPRSRPQRDALRPDRESLGSCIIRRLGQAVEAS